MASTPDEKQAGPRGPWYAQLAMVLLSKEGLVGLLLCVFVVGLLMERYNTAVEEAATWRVIRETLKATEDIDRELARISAERVDLRRRQIEVQQLENQQEREIIDLLKQLIDRLE